MRALPEIIVKNVPVVSDLILSFRYFAYPFVFVFFYLLDLNAQNNVEVWAVLLLSDIHRNGLKYTNIY